MLLFISVFQGFSVYLEGLFRSILGIKINIFVIFS